MSKTTKALAILGVVAGLGVASLPLSSYAAPVRYKAESAEGAGDGVGTLVDGQKSVTSGVTDINLEIDDILQIDNKLDSKTITLTNSAASGIAGLWTGDKSLELNVISNNPGGYKLTINGAGETGYETSLINSDKDAIVAATDANEALSPAVSTWGYVVLSDTVTAITAENMTGIETAGNTLADTVKPTAETGDTYKLAFGANIVDGQASGKYTGKVQFTATNKAKATAESGNQSSPNLS